jgi:uncharacterized membrane protein HdeD (DUF308 family)
VLFGGVLFASPGAGALALITVIGIYARIIGVLLVALSFRLKKHVHQMHFAAVGVAGRASGGATRAPAPMSSRSSSKPR